MLLPSRRLPWTSLRHTSLLALVAIAGLAVPRGAAAQRLLPVLVTDAHFTSATSAVRLPDGRLLVADAGARELTIVDSRGKVRVVGRTGSGPGEYRLPQFVIPRGSGALVIDPELRRVSEYNASAQFVRSSPFPAGRGASSLDMARSIDDSGTFVFVAPALGAASRELPPFGWQYPAGELHALRLDGTLRGPKWSTVALDAPAGGRSTAPVAVSYRVPYTAWDALLILRDGTRVVAHCDSRAVLWLGNDGRVLEKQAFPGEPILIPDSVRKAVRPMQLQAHLDERFPPFDGEIAVRSARDRVWLRAMPATNGRSVWYGFARGERKPQRVDLPQGALILAVFEPYLIVARRTASELQHIEVLRLQ